MPTTTTTTPAAERFTRKAMYKRMPKNNRDSIRWAIRMLRQNGTSATLASTMVWSAFHDGWILGHQDATQDARERGV